MNGLMQHWPLRVGRIIDHRRALSSQPAADHPHRRGADPDKLVVGDPRQGAACRAGASEDGDRPGRCGGGDGLEHRPPHGGLVRCSRRGRGAAHAQPPALRRPTGLYHQPCRGPGADGRHGPCPGDRGDPPPAGDRAALHHPDRRGAHARHQAAGPDLLRGLGGRGGRRFRLGAGGRDRGLRHLLHLRHHGQSQGRGPTPTARTRSMR